MYDLKIIIVIFVIENIREYGVYNEIRGNLCDSPNVVVFFKCPGWSLYIKCIICVSSSQRPVDALMSKDKHWVARNHD